MTVTGVVTCVREYVRGEQARPADRPTRVLVVDDEEPVIALVERTLRDAGYETLGATSGPDAIRLALTSAPFDLLVTDVQMPQMLGSELARHLRLHDPTLKVLYLTGFTDTLFRERVSLWADEAFLEKPCSETGLLEAVALLLRGRLPATRSCRPPSAAP